MQNIVSKLPWQKSMVKRNLSDIKYVIVHHDGSIAGEKYDALQLYAQEANYHISRGWGHLGYSIRIARNGKVYQAVPYEEIGVHAGNYTYFKNSLGVCLDGDFSRQEPSASQLAALRELMSQLSYHSPTLPNITAKSWFGHKEVRGIGIPGTAAFISNPTFCPGDVITGIVRSFRTDVPPVKVVPSEKVIKGNGPEIYIYNGKWKYHIPDMETLTFLFPGVAVQVADDTLIKQIPNGGDIPSMK